MLGRKEDAERTTGSVERTEGQLGGQRMPKGELEGWRGRRMLRGSSWRCCQLCPGHWLSSACINPAWAEGQQPGEKPKANPRFVCAFFSPSCRMEESHKLKALERGASKRELVSLAPCAALLLQFPVVAGAMCSLAHPSRGAPESCLVHPSWGACEMRAHKHQGRSE